MEKEIKLTPGKYVIQVQAIQLESDESSAMAPYLAEHAMVTKENEKVFVTLMIKEQEIVTGFQIEDNDETFVQSIDQQIDEEANVRYEIFPLNKLTTTVKARVQYTIPHEGKDFSGDELLRLFFDRQSIQNTKEINF